MKNADHELDAVIFGGGAAGLWLLDELRRRGFSSLLLEASALGAGQTIFSQGILHGGLKYTLSGLLSGSAQAVRDAMESWQACLHGESEPDLRGVRVLSPCCHLWRTDSLSSRLSLAGARFGLRTPVEKVSPPDRPAILSQCPGDIFRVGEPVLDVGSLLDALCKRNSARILLVGDPAGVSFAISKTSVEILVRHPVDASPLKIATKSIILTAGEGNEALLRAVGFASGAMQRRPLHQVMVRGNLPDLFGHCVDGAMTRVTVTSARDSRGRTVWHLGGEIAEKGVERSVDELIANARSELPSVVPGLDLIGAEWATYRVNRAEGKTADGRRPDGPVFRREGAVIAAWPTKLVLVPRLATLIADELGKPAGCAEREFPANWPKPSIAQYPWERQIEWRR